MFIDSSSQSVRLFVAQYSHTLIQLLARVLAELGVMNLLPYSLAHRFVLSPFPFLLCYFPCSFLQALPERGGVKRVRGGYPRTQEPQVPTLAAAQPLQTRKRGREKCESGGSRKTSTCAHITTRTTSDREKREGRRNKQRQKEISAEAPYAQHQHLELLR